MATRKPALSEPAPQSAKPPRKQRLRDKRPERYAEILKHATRVLATEGYQAMNVNQIAELAGVGVGTLYNYFDDKDDLFLTCVEAASQTDLFLKKTRVDLEQPVLDVVRAIFRVEHELSQLDPEGQLLLRSVFYGINSNIEVGAAAQEMYRGSIELVEQVLKRGVKEKVFDLGGELRLTALLINGLMETFHVLGPFLGEDQKPGDPLPTERAFELLCRGIQ